MLSYVAPHLHFGISLPTTGRSTGRRDEGEVSPYKYFWRGRHTKQLNPPYCPRRTTDFTLRPGARPFSLTQDRLRV